MHENILEILNTIFNIKFEIRLRSYTEGDVHGGLFGKVK
jgi:hypothetical protein